MEKSQRLKFETFVRVRDYGLAHQDLFPESSVGGQAFAQMTAIVAAIDEHLKRHIRGRAEAQRVKTATRADVFSAMKTIAHAARRAARWERGANPFRIPRRRSLKVDIATARVFIDEAATRQEQFARFGLPPSFISDFTTLVDALQQAVDVRLSSKTVRRLARVNIETELARGSELIRDLDVMVAVAAKDDPARLAAWRAARRVEGGTPVASDAAPAAQSTTPAASADERSAGAPVTADAASPPAADATLGDVTTVEAPVLVLDKAS